MTETQLREKIIKDSNQGILSPTIYNDLLYTHQLWPLEHRLMDQLLMQVQTQILRNL